jgi:hypothetical protein
MFEPVHAPAIQLLDTPNGLPFLFPVNIATLVEISIVNIGLYFTGLW